LRSGIGKSPNAGLHESDLLRYLVPAGRLLYAVIFIMSFGHFSQQTVDYAAGQGIPMDAPVDVP
jgi:hypothetical protein